MKNLFVKIIASVLFFYNAEKRKNFRKRYSLNAMYCAKLRKQKILGDNSYISASSTVADRHSRIGKYCSIGKNVFIGTTTHPTDFLTTSPIPYTDITSLTQGVSVPKEKQIKFEPKTPVFIGNDVWIGVNVVIMDGIKIGDGAIIGAGAVVTKDIPPYAIAVGVPAKVLKYRFSPEIIERLLKTSWWDRPHNVVKELPFSDVEKCLEILENTAS